MHWLNWIIGYVIFVIGLPHGQGSCVFEGIQIENGTVWKSDSCHICTCLSPVTVCEQVTCQDPRCNIQQGEVYRIPSGNCCPECFTPGPPCVYKGQTREIDSKWHVSLCESCHCTEKGVICTNETCPALHCKHGEEKQSLPHVCCPKCVPTGSSCVYQGVHYLDGAVWEPTPCIRCSCQDGEVTCFTAHCPDLRCDQGSSVVQLPSTCCPQCVEDMCYVGGKQYKSGDEWQEDSCTYCRCSSGHSQCRKVQCEDTIQCEPGEKKLLKPGDCCPSCVAEEAPCVYSGGLYYHGDMWNTSQCEFCTCDRGRVNCHQARCERRHCEQDSPLCYTKYCCDSGHQCVQEKLLTTKGTVTVLPAGFVNRLSQDWPSDTSVRVIEEPRHGSMVSQMYGPASTFTVSSLRSGDIMYRHDGGEALYDSVLLQISDGRKVKNELLEIEVQSKGKSVPVMEVNMGAKVEMGKMVLLTKDMLHFVSGGKQKSNLIYTITDNPKEGTLLMIVPIPPDGARRGWKDRGDGTMGATMYRFLQRDVDEKRLWYQHKGRASTGKDRFIFEVSEGTNSPNILRNQVFHISVSMPQGDAPSTAPTVAPGVDLSMKVFENQLVPIMSAHLAFENIDSDDRDIVYTITRPLQSTQGSVEHIREPFQPVFRFTQEDINMNKIIYRPPMTEIGPEEKKFTFDFIVQDKTSGFAIPKQTFSIHVMPVNNMPPRVLQNEPSVKVTQGGSVLLGPDVIALIDTDTSIDDLSLTLTQNPVAGKVTKTSNGRRSELGIGEEMTYADVKNNAVMYQHDGSRRLEDMLHFKVSDGVHTVPVGVKVSVTRADRASPMADKQASFSMTLPEGDTSTIEKKHMAFTDIDTSDDKLTIKVVMDPMQGTLKRGREILTLGSSFTQQDINDGMIKYTAASEIGSRPINEILYFNVTDPNNHVLANQILTITIEPVNNQAPVVTVGPGVEVEEGGRVQLTPQHLSAMDMDTPVSLLTVVIDALPSFGVVKNSLRGLGSEHGRPSVVTTFPLQDLLDGGVYYVQTDHKNKEPVADGFLFHVTDGTNDSPSQRFNISILLTNDESPVMVTEQLHCQEGRGVVMTNATMYVIDFDSVPEELLFTVEALPQHGKLRRKEYIQDMIFSGQELQQGATFTYEDILNELIGYTHEGGEVDGDEFTLQLTDGKFTDRKTMKVVIGLVNDETPRVVVNRGLQVSAGSTTVIENNLLKASDVDSEDSQIIYTITEDLSSGKLKLVKGQLIAEITKDGHQSGFTQSDIDEGHIQYVHDVSEPAGPTLFKFRLSDPEDNVLIDQSFVITVLEDRIPPQVTANKEFSVKEGGAAKITTQFLSATDTDSEPANLLFSVLTPPQLGHIALVGARGMPVSQFRQSDLAAGQVQYVHTSSEEIYMDSFTFSVTDGTNDVTQTFYLTITPVDDSLPVVSVHGLKVQEGVRKVITEFDLKAVDKDTKEDHVFFTVIQHPRHGSLDLLYNGQQTQATRFSMADIYENRVSYQHDGSETLLDSFTFTTSDGTNNLYMMQQDQPEGVPLSRPLLFEIAVSPVDDGSPIITTNLGLHYLEYVNGKAMNAITSKELKATDLDTQDKALIYQIKEPPQYGRIENSANPDVPISLFSQEDINNGVIRYVLFTSTNETKDKFTFDLMDSKPNIVKEQVFHIRWSYINFELPDINITESSGVIRVPVKRIGNLKQYSIVQCKAIPGSAVSASSATGIVRPGMNDYEAFMGQVQFDEWQDTKTCTIVINDDSIFEGPETFYVELSQPAYALLGTPTKASITIYDLEDEPVVQFEKGLYHVNESDGFLYATLTRSGDLSSSSSVVCSTLSMTAIGSGGSRLESGADFKTRQQTDANRVVFSAGETEASCDVQIIDDSNYETLEQFEIVLSDPSMMTKVGPISKAIVIIDGPNDESLISFAHESAWFDEDAGIVEIPVIRDGSDLSHSSMVWCATKMVNPPSATPGQDYVPTSNQITFGPGQNVQVCKLTILDDNADPRVEGNETFIVFLSSAMGSSLTEPISALITINDTDLDIPTMQFEKLSYVIDEEEKFLDIPVIRTGDLSYSSSVICFTRQKTAHVMMDFHERTKTQDSRITFFPGEQ
ncbi:extracellular matrix protein FRAS1-like, partial [Lingula anatina]|uniref:Extracellular matrix protein FRAS1-like n=1 Tax=Lingula anatina TaxID=7574 RepID=A0A1S3K984_LINAN